MSSSGERFQIEVRNLEENTKITRLNFLGELLVEGTGDRDYAHLGEIDQIIAGYVEVAILDYLEAYSDWPLSEGHKIAIYLGFYKAGAKAFLDWLRTR